MGFLVFPGGAHGKESICQCRRHKRHRFDPWVGKIPWRRVWQPLQCFAWRTPWTEEPGRLWCMGSQRAGHDWSDLAWCIVELYVILPVFSKSPVNVLSYFHNLKHKKEKNQYLLYLKKFLRISTVKSHPQNVYNYCWQSTYKYFNMHLARASMYQQLEKLPP